MNTTTPTPRTDAEEKRQRDLYAQEMECGWPSFPADFDFARQLECDLAEDNDRIRRLIAERDTARIEADRKHVLRAEFAAELGVENGSDYCVERGLEAIRRMKKRADRLEKLLSQTTTELAHASSIISENLIDCKMYVDHWNRLCTEATATLADRGAAKEAK